MNTKERVNQIRILATQLPASEQESLLKELRKQIMKQEAKQLDEGILPNCITMDEIVEEVNIVRRKNYQNSIKSK